jgi:hypothetical protein
MRIIEDRPGQRDHVVNAFVPTPLRMPSAETAGYASIVGRHLGVSHPTYGLLLEVPHEFIRVTADQRINRPGDAAGGKAARSHL